MCKGAIHRFEVWALNLGRYPLLSCFCELKSIRALIGIWYMAHGFDLSRVWEWASGGSAFSPRSSHGQDSSLGDDLRVVGNPCERATWLSPRSFDSGSYSHMVRVQLYVENAWIDLDVQPSSWHGGPPTVWANHRAPLQKDLTTTGFRHPHLY